MHALEGAPRDVTNGTPRVFVDLTTSLRLAGETPIGITRVEGELARRLLLSPSLNTIPVVFRADGLLMALSSEQVERIFRSNLTASGQSMPAPAAEELSNASEEVASHPSAPGLATKIRLRATAGLRRMLRTGLGRMPSSIRGDVRAILLHMRQIARTVLYRNKVAGVPAPQRGFGTPPLLRDEILPTLRAVVHPREGDVLWTAGLYSNFVPLRAIGEIKEKTGLKVVTTCYDLIRVTYPQYNPPSMNGDLFVADAVTMLDTSDLVLAISDWSRREFVAFAERVGRPKPKVEVVQLGCDLSKPQSKTASRPVLPNNLSQRRFALAVGTIEPRKNYGLLVRAWERLAKDAGFSLDLVIVGRQGFESEKCVAELTRSSLFGRRIHWLKDCSDDMLRHLYETSHALVYPTFIEGWGLPVTEALSFGCPVIASNRGAIEEAGHGLARLLDPDDEEQWVQAIAEVAAGPRKETWLKNPPSWETAAAQVEKQLMRLTTLREAT